MTKLKKEYFLLYANCIPVKGKSRSSIYDIQRNSLRLIPNLIYDVLQDAENSTKNELKKKYNNEYDNEIDTFFEELVEDEIGFFTDTPELFPKLSLDWEYPGEISNSIVVIDEKSSLDYISIFKQLDDLGCNAVEIRFINGYFSTEFVENILKKIEGSRIVSITIIIPYSSRFDADRVSANLRLSRLIIHSAKENKVISHDYTECSINYTTKIIDKSSCGQICKDNLIINTDLFRESQNFNSCLNKKVSINEVGDIMNCPSLNENFGNVTSSSIKKIIAESDFQKLWHIKKDDIDICKSCEFRYSCIDCRAYTQNLESRYSKPIKCTYNPETMTW